MDIFFDVDHTIVSWDGILRPYTKEIFKQLKDDGHQLYIWSGVGLRWEVVRQHHLEPYIETCFLKPLEDHQASLARLGVTVQPEFVIDDHRGVVQAFGGIQVTPFYPLNPDDREMLRVYAAVLAHLDGGRPP